MSAWTFDPDNTHAMSDHQTLCRINRALHKEGKHACYVCLTIYERTPDNFRWQNQSRGLLMAICKTCYRKTRQKPVATWESEKRRKLTAVLQQSRAS